MKFIYSSGPYQNLDIVETHQAIAADRDVPLILNGFYRIRPDLKQKFSRLRDAASDRFDPEITGSLDRLILETDSVQGDDYRNTLSTHFNDLLESYDLLESHTLLVPGPYDVEPEDIKSFSSSYDIEIARSELSGDKFKFEYHDAEVFSPEGKQVTFLAVGGVTDFMDGLPDLIQHGKFLMMEETSWKLAVKLLSRGADFLVLQAGVEGTYDPDLSDPGTFKSLSWDLSISLLIMDCCVSLPDPEKKVTDVKGIPILHGKQQDESDCCYLIEYDLKTENRISITAIENGSETGAFEHRDGDWYYNGDLLNV